MCGPGMTRGGRGAAAAHTTASRVTTPSAATYGGRPRALTTSGRVDTGQPNQNGGGAGDVRAVTIARRSDGTTQAVRNWRGKPPGGNDGGVMAYRLRAGDTGPVQQSPVTCGSACLTVARMLVDPLVRVVGAHRAAQPARVAGRRHRGRALRGLRAHRDAAHQQPVRRVATDPTSRGRAGSAPRRGGRCASSSTARPGSARSTRSTCCAPRARTSSSRRSTPSSTSSPRASPPCSTSGNTFAPRHVVLVLPGDGDRMLDVYDPASGRVDHLRRDTVVQRRLGLSGWDVPWVAVRPTGLRTVRSKAVRRRPGRRPRLTATGQAVGLATGTSSTSRAATSSPTCEARGCR